MGKKSRIKKEKKHNIVQEKFREQNRQVSEEKRGEPFLVKLMQWGVYLALLTPLVINSNFYFPFVGPKSLFFMAAAELVFFAWLILLLNYKEYRPRFNSVSAALALFLFVLTLSAVLGVDFSRSFWSNYERMTGILMWLHLFAFFLAISSTFQKRADWRKIFAVSVSVAFLVSLMAFLEIAGVEAFKFSPKGGSTLGNTSFLGTYLLFNGLLAVWLFFEPGRGLKQRNRTLIWRTYLMTAAITAFFAIYLSQADAAFLCFLGGLALISLLWCAFKANSEKIRIAGRIILGLSAVGAVIAIVLVFIPGNPLYQHFFALVRARYVNWEMAEKAFLEKPILGWGPENYILTFTRFFNPCLFTSACGGEIWFDRSHNIIFDTLSTTGVMGFFSYLGIFAALTYVLWKKYFREKNTDFWTLAVFTAILAAYFIQNLTVFDMIGSLLMFVLIVGFIGFLAALPRDDKESVRKFRLRHQGKIGFLLVIFFFTFLGFVIQPLRTDYTVIESLKAASQENRLKLYQKALSISSLGKYQIREFFAQNSQEIIEKNIRNLSGDEIKQELDFVIEQLKKTEKESPLEYRSIIRLAYLYNLYALVEPAKIDLALQYSQRAIEMSPKNQQGYWALSQARIFQHKEDEALELVQKAVDLEPMLLRAHQTAIKVAEAFDREDKIKEIIERAVKINPQWEGELKDISE